MPRNAMPVCEGDYRWGGPVAWSRCPCSQASPEGGVRYGGSVDYSTDHDCGPCFEALGCCVPQRLWVQACARKPAPVITDPPVLLPACSGDCVGLMWNGNPGDPHWLGTILLANGDSLGLDVHPESGHWEVDCSGCNTGSYPANLTRCMPFCLLFLPHLCAPELGCCCADPDYQDTILRVTEACCDTCSVDASVPCCS